MTSLLHRHARCTEFRASFSDYLDGLVSGHTMGEIAGHLKECVACEHEFAAWRMVQESLAALRRPKAPQHLALKLRLAISHEQSRQSAGFFDALSVRWINSIRPLLVQVSAGFAVTIALLGTVGFLLGTVAAPEAVLANDEPLGAMTAPHYLYSVEQQRPVPTAHDATIVVEAEINDRGQVFDYQIVSGPLGPAAQIQIGNQLLLSVFEPARVFGVPVRGRVVMTFAGVSVRA